MNDLEKHPDPHADTSDSGPVADDNMYRGFIENLPVLFYAVAANPPFAPFYVSPAFERFGYPIEMWKTDPDIWAKVIHPEDQGWVFTQTDASTWCGEEVDYEYRIVNASGKIHWVRDRGCLVRGENGIVLGREGVILDVTDRRLAEQALRISEDRYRNLFENANDVIYVLDLEGNFISMNQAAERVFGYTRDEALTMNIARIAVSEEPGVTEKVAEMDFRRKDGSLITLEINNSVITQNGVPVAVQGIGRDVTERRRQNDAIKESEYRYRQLSEGIFHQVWTADPNGKLDYVNERTLKYFGRESIELLGNEWQHVVHPDDLAECVRRWTHSIATGDIYEADFRLKRHDGVYRWHKSRATCGRDEDGNVTKWFGTNSDVDDQKQSEAKLNYLARHDPLTDLPNRAEFMNHLRKAIERADANPMTRFAVLFLDLDRFKVVNDSLGHVVGDELLRQIGERLPKYVRPGDVVARLGGDEFTILLNRTGSVTDVVGVAERVQRSLSTPFQIGTNEVFTSASIGIIVSDDIMREPEDFLRDADAAMYRAKDAGKARYEVFDREMHARNLNLLELENDLRRALEKDEFELVYQPIVELSTGSVYEFEALLRWRHPKYGLVGPNDFVGAAEESGLIIPIGNWVIREACARIAEWQESSDTKLSVSVNLSAKQLMHPSLIAQVRTVLKETELSAKQLKLEVTESTVMEHSERSMSVLSELAELGVSLATDDFGTGYSSLSYLQQFPFDRLKIDRSFIDKMGDDKKSAAIVKTILMLGENLDIEVVAEGIETEQQLESLRRLGCRLGQGYILSRPVEAPKAASIASLGLDNFTGQRTAKLPSTAPILEVSEIQ